jgi:hypothetical protein
MDFDIFRAENDVIDSRAPLLNENRSHHFGAARRERAHA